MVDVRVVVDGSMVNGVVVVIADFHVGPFDINPVGGTTRSDHNAGVVEIRTESRFFAADEDTIVSGGNRIGNGNIGCIAAVCVKQTVSLLNVSCCGGECVGSFACEDDSVSSILLETGGGTFDDDVDDC